MNLARVKLRDQQSLAHGPLREYSQFGEGIRSAMPCACRQRFRRRSARPHSQVQGRGKRSNAYIYFITQAPVWEKICDVIGEPNWKTDSNYAKPAARLPRLNEIFARIETVDDDQDKFEAMEILNKTNPLRPDPVDEEIAEDQSLRATGTVVEVDHPTAAIRFGRQSDQAVGLTE